MKRTCELTPDNKKSLMSATLNNMAESMVSDTPFSAKDFMRSIYNKMTNNRTGEDLEEAKVRAFAYIKLVPSAIQHLLLRSESKGIVNYFIENNIPTDYIPLKIKVEDEKTGADFIINYLNLNNEVPQPPIEEFPVEVETTSARYNEIAHRLFRDPLYANVPPVVMIDFSFETYARDEEQRTKPLKLDPNEVFYYKVKRKILDEIYSSGTDSSEMNFPGVGPVFLRMVHHTALKNPDLGLLRVGSSTGNDLSAVMILIDKDGNPLKFDKDGNYDPKGRVAYYNFPRVEQSHFYSDGSYNKSIKIGNQDFDKIVDSYMDVYPGNSREVVEQLITRDLHKMADMRTYLSEHPTEQLDIVITGGSYGVVKRMGFTEWRRFANLTEINFDGGDFKFEIAGKNDPIGRKNGAAYFTTNYTGNSQLEIERPEISGDMAEKIASIIFDDIYLEDAARQLRPITNSERLQIVNGYIYNEDDRQYTTQHPREFGIWIKPNAKGVLTAKMRGDYLKVNTPEEKAAAKELVKEYLITVGPKTRKKVGESPENGGPTEKQLLKQIYSDDPEYKTKIHDLNNIGSLFSKRDPDGKVVEQWTVDVPKLHIKESYHKNEGNKDALEQFLDVDIDNTGGKKVARPTGKTLTQWVNQYFRAGYNLDADNKIQKYNAYFSTQPTQDALNKVYAEEEKQDQANISEFNHNPATQEDTEKDLRSRFKKDDEDVLNKLRSQRYGPIATEKQLEEAETWYKTSPLNDLVPFKAAFDTVNKANRQSVATMTLSGITLYEGSNYSDLYHEAWHVFTQGFLTRADKKKLYREVGKLSGSFIDHDGKSISFANASDEQLEEFLAEDFRAWKLSGGKKQTGPARKSIYRKLLAILKVLFGNTTYGQALNDDNVTYMMHELYEKLSTGNLSEYTFDQQNAIFGNLNKGVRKLNANESREYLSYRETQDIMNMMNSLMSTTVDFLNAGVNSYTELKEYYRLKTKERNGRITQKERETLDSFNIKNKPSHEWTTNIFSGNNGKLNAYREVKRHMDIIYKEMLVEYENFNENTPSDKRDKLANDIMTFRWILNDNFGDTENILKNTKGSGLIAYHLENSPFLTKAEKQEFFDEAEEPEGLEGLEHGKSGNEKSIFELADEEVIYLVTSLHQVDSKGELLPGRFNVPPLAPLHHSWNRIAITLAGSLDINEMERKLREEAKHFPVFNQLLEKLGPIPVDASKANMLWTKFWKTFNPSEINLIQFTLDETSIDAISGLPIPPSYIIKVGNAYRDFEKVGRTWENNFRINRSNPFLKRKEGRNYLDTESIIKKYPTSRSIRGREVEFLRDMGITLEDTAPIQEALAKGKGNPTAIWETIYNLNNRGEIIYNLSDIVKKVYIATSATSLSTTRSGFREINHPTITPKKDDWNQLQILQATYSDEFMNFMVQNAEGQAQFEHTLNNTMTVVAHAINSSKDFSDLMNMSHMSYLNPDRNSFARASKWLSRLYKFTDDSGVLLSKNDPEYGKRRREDPTDPTSPYIKLEIKNLSGIAIERNKSFINDEGIATANADEFAKAIFDFHMATRGYFEAMRHSDKTSSFYAGLSMGPAATNDAPGLYISPVSFLKGSQGEEIGYSMILPHLIAEQERVLEFKKLKEDNINNLNFNFDFTYLHEGSKFVMFDGILTQATKDELIGIPDLKKFLTSGTINAAKLDLTLRKEIKEYFEGNDLQEGLVPVAIKKLTEEGYISPGDIGMLKSRSGDGTLDNNTVKEALIRSFTYNQWIHNVESLVFFYGDLAQYNYLKEEFHKRNALVSSTGNLFRTDVNIQALLNNPIMTDRSYAKSIGLDPSLYNGVFNTAILADTGRTSVYMNEIRDAEEKAVIRNWKKRIDEEKDPAKKQALIKERNQEIEEVIAPYTKKEMEEGNAQGYITFDAYKQLKIAAGDWSPKQDALFKLIVSGKYKGQKLQEFFPVMKLQMFGPLATDGPPIWGAHKFSLFPLIPSVVGDGNHYGGEQLSNIGKLHQKMLKEDIQYVVFKTGSKVGTLTKSGVQDQLYKDNDQRTFNDQGTFTKNPIYVNYLKDQLKISPKFKGKTTFSSQMRKLIEDGLYEFGIPTDFRIDLPKDDRIKQWEELTDPESAKYSLSTALDESKNFRLVKKYEDAVKALSYIKRQSLLEEMNWTEDKDGLHGSVEELLKFIREELESQDLAEHELEFLHTDSNGKPPDLSASPSAAKIENLLNSIIVRRLVKQKVKGESLIQLASVGFERIQDLENGKIQRNFSNPTEEEKKYYGSGDLPFYYRTKDVSTGEYGNTRAMKVKIAMQGDFRHLLKDEDVVNYSRENDVPALRALNKLLKQDWWLDKGDNRRMVTMIGTRIPTQGLNSMEFMEIYEFLDESAGTVIIPPPEITAKSGSDFDIDKLTITMPNIIKIKGKPYLVKKTKVIKNLKELETKREELRESVGKIHDKYTELKEQLKNLTDFTKLTPEERSAFNQIVTPDRQALKAIREKLAELLSRKKKALSNKSKNKPLGENIVRLQEEIEETQLLFETEDQKITDNERNYREEFSKEKHIELTKKYDELNERKDAEMQPIKDEIDDLSILIAGNSEMVFENELLQVMKEILEIPENYHRLMLPNSTRIVKPVADDLEEKVSEYNPKRKHNADGKLRYDPKKPTKLVISPTRALEWEYNLYKHKSNNIGKQVLGMGAVDNTWNSLFNRVGAYMNPEIVSAGHTRRQTILMPHNTLNIKGKAAISLSHLRDANDENTISDVISQLINGWVDIAKDAWIFNIQGNRELAPTLLFLVQAGVPFKTAVYFVSQPLIREYVRQQKRIKSTFSRPLGTSVSDPLMFRRQARLNIIEDAKNHFNLGNNVTNKNLYAAAVTSTENVDFSEENLYDHIKKGEETSDFDRAAFLHFIEIEEMVKPTTGLKVNINVDTKKSGTLYEAHNRLALIDELTRSKNFPPEIVSRVSEDSPISSFFVQEFQQELFKDLFILRNHPRINGYIYRMLAERENPTVNVTYPGNRNRELFSTTWKNDLMSYVFQNSLLPPIELANLKSYKGYSINKTHNVKRVAVLKHGAFIENDNIYIDPEQLESEFISGVYTDPEYTKENEWKRGVAPIQNKTVFTRDSDYYRFILEREILRSRNPYSKLKDTSEYQAYYSTFIDKVARKSNETEKHFEERQHNELYEMFLRDKALDNMYNYWKMFKSENTYADQFTIIMEMFKDNKLEELYPVLDVISGAPIKSGNNKFGNNIRLNDMQLTGDKLNLYHENLLELANPSITKVENYEDNLWISNFFKKFSTMAFMQSGINTKGAFSLVRMVPTTEWKRLTEDMVKNFTKNLNGSILDDYNRTFTTQNMASRGSDRYRSKVFLTRSNMRNLIADKVFEGEHQAAIEQANLYPPIPQKITGWKTIFGDIRGSFEMILQGLRTRTSRTLAEYIKYGEPLPGSYRWMEGPGDQKVLVKITDVYVSPYSNITKQNRKGLRVLSEEEYKQSLVKEGWANEYLSEGGDINSKEGLKKKIGRYPISIEFEVADKPEEVADFFVEQVIAGGQTGGDLGGLEGAKRAGVKTGGTAPPGWVSGNKNEKALLESYGLTEGVPDPRTYPFRTMKNVDDSTGSLTILWGPSAGTQKTIDYAKTGKWKGVKDTVDPGFIPKPILVIKSKNLDNAVRELKAFMKTNNIRILNVAGHREASQPGIQKFTNDLVFRTLSELRAELKPEVPIPSTVTGNYTSKGLIYHPSGLIEYVTKDLTPTTAQKLQRDNPDIYFIHNDQLAINTIDGFIGSQQFVNKNNKLANRIGIPTVNNFVKDMSSGKITDLDGKIRPEVKQAIDTVIGEMIKVVQEGKTLAFVDQRGYGKYMLEDAPETFFYLSEQLFKFGYINPGMKTIQRGLDIIQSKQEISDAQVTQIKIKFGPKGLGLPQIGSKNIDNC